MQLLSDPRSLSRSASQLLKALTMLSSAYMMYAMLGVVTNSPTPIVVVLSGSMEPAFQRGDVLFMVNWGKVDVGDVVVYDTEQRSIPIVHRVMRDHSSSKKQLILTKGDNNPTDDIDLYGRKKLYLDRQKDITGGYVIGYVPWIGYVTILMQENPMVKTALIGGSVLLSFVET